MSPSELNRQVAAATGESVAEIRTRGFSIHVPGNIIDEPSFSRPQRAGVADAARRIGMEPLIERTFET